MTPLVHKLCAPGLDGAAAAASIGALVGVYAGADGALRMLCDALLHEWLQGAVARGAVDASGRGVLHGAL